MKNKFTVYRFDNEGLDLNSYRDIKLWTYVQDHPEKFEDICCIEVFQQGYRGDRDKSEQIFAEFDKLLKRFYIMRKTKSSFILNTNRL
jgi:hypothetical protein